MMKFVLLSCVLTALVARSMAAPMPGPPYPATNSTCDYKNCTGCDPFEPPQGTPQELLCGYNDIYFPVPTLIVLNDTSPTKELYPARWLCIACCKANCGFNDIGSVCRHRNYRYNASAINTYGCVHCHTKNTLKQYGGTVTTQYMLESTKTVYKTVNLGFGLCSQYGIESVPPTPSSPMPPMPSTPGQSPAPPTTSPPSPKVGPSSTSPPPPSPSPPGSGAMSVSVLNAVLALVFAVVVAI